MARTVTILVVSDERDAVRGAERVAAAYQAAGRQVETGFGANLRRVSNQLRDTGASLRQAGAQMTTFATIPVAAAMYGSFRAASNLSESINAIDVVFGNAAGTLHRFGETSAEAVGLSTRAFNEMATPVGAALRNAGLGADEAAASTIQLTQRASDMASVFNTDVSDAMGAVQAALRGEADPIERYGVNMSAAAVQAEALAMGINKSWNEMSAQEKAQARLSLFFKQTARVQNDFANTADEAANSERILRAEVENAAAGLGTALLPIAKQVVTAFRGWVESFNELSPQMQRFVLIGAAAVAAVGPLTTIIGGLVTVVGLLISPVALVIAAIAAVAAGVYLAYRNIDGFREIVDEAGRSIMETFQEVVAWAQEWWPQVQEAIEHVVVAIQAAWRMFGDDILTIVRGAFGRVIGMIRSAMMIVQGVIQTVTALINGDWGKAWEGVKKILSGVLGGIAAQIVGWLRTVQGIFGGFFNILQRTFGPPLAWIWKQMQMVWDKIITATTTAWRAVTGAVSAAVSGVVSAVGWVVNAVATAARAVGGAFRAVVDAVTGFISSVANLITTVVSTVVNRVTVMWNAFYEKSLIMAVVKAMVMSAWNAITTIFRTALGIITTAFSLAWRGLVTILRPIITLITGIVTGAWAIILSISRTTFMFVRTVIGQAFDWILGKIRTVWNAVYGVIAMVGGLITEWFRRFKDTIIGLFSTALTWLTSAGRKVLTGLWDGAKAVWQQVKEWVGGIGQGIKDQLTDAREWLVETGKDVLRGLIDGGRAILRSIGGFLDDIKDAIWNGIKEVFGISSPSTLMAELGGDMMRGLIEGLLTNVGHLRKVLQSLGLNAWDFMQSAFDWVTGAFGDLLGSLGIGSGGLAEGLMEEMQGLAGNPGVNRMLGQQLANAFGWGTGAQWSALNQLVMSESGWNNLAQNPTSTAFGIGQFLDSTWATVGARKTSDPASQITAMLRYIGGRYGNPMRAWNFKQAMNWYAGGGVVPGAGPVPAVVHGGEMVLNKAQQGSLFRQIAAGEITAGGIVIHNSVSVAITAEAGVDHGRVAQLVREQVRAEQAEHDAALFRELRTRVR